MQRDVLYYLTIYELLYDRNVLIIGGSDEYDRKRAESVDVVVRINQHLFKQDPARCHMLFTAACEPCRLAELKKPPLAIAFDCIAPYAQQYKTYAIDNKCLAMPFVNQSYKDKNPYSVTQEWCNVLNKTVGTKPFTGMVALDYILQFPIKHVYCDGMDMHYATAQRLKTTTGETLLRKDAHDILPQVVWLSNKVKTDARITICDDLTAVITRMIK